MPSLAEQRAAVRTRQHAVTQDLLSGRCPEGFQPTAAQHTTRILLGKRAEEVAFACPELTELPQWRRRFAEYAAQHPAHGCGHTQMSEVTAWLRSRPDCSAAERNWLRLADVHASRRRAAVARVGGRRTVLIGLGDRVWQLGWPSFTRSPH